MWAGYEIEGGSSERTLFVRAATMKEIVHHAAGFKRVWFCKEFHQHRESDNYLRVIIDRLGAAKQIALEVDEDSLFLLCRKLFLRCQIYLKVTELMNLKPGDVICQGKPYAQETFVVGSGHQVTPNDYMEDERIL